MVFEVVHDGEKALCVRDDKRDDPGRTFLSGSLEADGCLFQVTGGVLDSQINIFNEPQMELGLVCRHGKDGAAG